ncbi:MAG: GDP-L-fucose synthase [candidate division KSB1 bacterium]|nr:GDP-L-fucose synthase [candidate division KSB1 bacterium]
MNLCDKIYIAGHSGMVGSALVRRLRKDGYRNLVTRTHTELDLLDQSAVNEFFQREQPDYVFLAAAKVGGILANNTYRAEFLYNNLMITANIIHASKQSGTQKLLNLGSSCIYPKLAPQPLKEEYLLTGPLELTNEPYAIAKIAGIKLCENYYRQYGCDFISVMPTNLYGPNDNYDLQTSHVLPALIRKFHLAKCLETNDWDAIRADLNKNPIGNVSGNAEQRDVLSALNKEGIVNSQKVKVEKSERQIPDLLTFAPSDVPTVHLWGSGSPRREFLYVEDLADACLHIMHNVSAPQLYDDLKQTHINIGAGTDVTIKDLAELIREITDCHCNIQWDTRKPDGTPRKLLNVDLATKLRWRYKTELRKGIERAYEAYKNA